MSLNHILLAVVVGGLFVLMMYMFIRIIFLPAPNAEKKASEIPVPKPKSK